MAEKKRVWYEVFSRTRGKPGSKSMMIGNVRATSAAEALTMARKLGKRFRVVTKVVKAK